MSSLVDTAYINSKDYKTLEPRLKDLKEAIDELFIKQRTSRKLRYADIDIEAERESGRLQPDELYIPQHIIDTNIRREQSPYVQYITQSPRAVILEDSLDPSQDLSLLERDLTKKIRYDAWQLQMFANIDCFQANGYAVMELVQDPTTVGELAYESIEFADFGFVSDCRDIQQLEMTARAFYFTKTRLKGLKGDPKEPNDESDWDGVQVDKLLDAPPSDNISTEQYDLRNQSLHQVYKVMFRVDGVVNVAWCAPGICDDWLRAPRALFIGRRKLIAPKAQNLSVSPPQQLNPQSQGQPQPNPVYVLYTQFMQETMDKGKLEDFALLCISKALTPPSEIMNETEYPYFLFPYLISENNTISNLKGRVYLDQDVQEATSSLMSSTCTQARRAAGLYGSKDANDPNDDVLMQENITLKSGCIINSKVSFTQLQGPEPGIFSAIQMIASANQNETSQVNFAVQNRKDSRKTAEEIKVASNQAQVLSTVQVVLFSVALKRLYSTMAAIIQSRVLSGLIIVNPLVLPQYARRIIVKPSGDTDVIEKQQMIQTMMSAWSVMQNTAASAPFLNDLLEKMFPDSAAKYIQAIQQAQQQAQMQQQQANSAQAQEMQQVIGMVKQMAGGIKKLADNPAMFSDMGRLHAFPIVEHYSDMIEQFEEKIKQSQQKKVQ